MNKKDIREKIKAEKKKLSREEIEDLSKSITKQFLNAGLYQKADAFLIYSSYNQEVRTQYLAKWAWQNGKAVFYPKTDEKRMHFLKTDDLSWLKPGAYGIPEPKEGEEFRGGRAVMILPGLAFDKNGGRIGYGGGFYDRYLEEMGDTYFLKAAFAYEFQLFDKLPTENFDKKVDWIITPEEVLRCKK